MLASEGVNRIKSDLSIALCTCEGSFFLPKQLESLASQTILPGEIVVCDDASTDGTVGIIKEFAGKVPFRVNIIVNKDRLGAIKNFEQAIALCKGKFIALCDQDDIWYENRLEKSLQCMAEVEKDTITPLLVHSDLSVIDRAGKLIAPSYMKARRIKHREEQTLNYLVAQNFVTGNTILFNRVLKEIALPVPDQAVMHDWWLALVAAATGNVNFIEQPTVQYRQHRANVIGPGKMYSGKNLMRALDFEILEKELATVLSQAFALEERLKACNLKNPEWLGLFLREVGTGKGLAPLKAAFRAGVHKQGLLRNMVYYMLLLKSDYKDYLR